MTHVSGVCSPTGNQPAVPVYGVRLGVRFGIRSGMRFVLALIMLVAGFIVVDNAAVTAIDWGTIVIPRIKYGGGGDWYTDPTSMVNLLKEANKRLNLPTHPENLVIGLTDQELFNYPMIYLTGHGNVKFQDHEVNLLLTYFDNGGFLWIDDCYGIDKSIRRELRRVFPDKELVPLPPDHEIYRTVYDLTDGLPKIHEHDGKPPAGYAIFHKGRMVVFYSFETDIGDGLEDEGVHPEDSPQTREQAMQMALNILVFAMTQ